MVMTRHPEAHVRRAVRVLAMVGELHRRGYQKLRVMPFMSPSGTAWRCWIGPDTLFYRNHGAFLCDSGFSEVQSASLNTRYTSGEENHYFGWHDAEKDDARSLADKFLARSTELGSQGEGWSYVTPMRAGINDCLAWPTKAGCRWFSPMTTLPLIRRSISMISGQRSGVRQMRRSRRCRCHLPENLGETIRTS